MQLENPTGTALYSLEKAIKELRCECLCFKQEDAEKILNELNKFKFREGDHVK